MGFQTKRRAVPALRSSSLTSTASFVSGSRNAPPEVGQVAVPTSLRNTSAGRWRRFASVAPCFDAKVLSSLAYHPSASADPRRSREGCLPPTFSVIAAPKYSAEGCGSPYEYIPRAFWIGCEMMMSVMISDIAACLSSTVRYSKAKSLSHLLGVEQTVTGYMPATRSREER